MMTGSVMFVYFVFGRLMFNIRKLADEEHLQEHPEAKSVILDLVDTAVPEEKCGKKE